MKPHEVSIVLRHHGGHVVEPELARHTGHGFEGMDVAAHQGLKRLAVRELEIHLPAVTLDEAEGVQLSRVAFIHKRPKWPQSISKRSPAAGSMRTKARRVFVSARMACK